jgi:hypothetical protein
MAWDIRTKWCQLALQIADSSLRQLDGVASAYYRQGFLQGLEVRSLGCLKRRMLGLKASEFLLYELNACQLGFTLVRHGV